eukprot:6630476-Pyramimonas_sp.AAC.1
MIAATQVDETGEPKPPIEPQGGPSGGGDSGGDGGGGPNAPNDSALQPFATNQMGPKWRIVGTNK